VLVFALSVCSVFAAHVRETNGWGPEKVQQYSGYITVAGSPQNGTHLYYWFFESRSQPATDPLILWLTGGPGCSSLLAMFVENGPYIINKHNESVSLNPYSWNSFANVIWLDQPVGTGFSYADHIDDYAFDEKIIADDVYTFLQTFLTIHPKYQAAPLYIMGESYAGHYVPAIGVRVVAGGGSPTLNLKAISIGNGWVDPALQYERYAPFAYDNGLIDEIERDIFVAQSVACVVAVKSYLFPIAMDLCNLLISEIQAAGGNFNVYDIRLPCSTPGLCYDFSYVDKLLNKESVQEALGVNRTWVECDTAVHELLLGDWLLNYEKDIPSILNAGVRVLIYSGMEDFICNYYGGGNWTASMPWPGQSAFNAAQMKPWALNSTTVGYAKASQNFTWVEVLRAGHMVPMDQPQAALDLVRRFLNNLPFTQ